MHGAPAVSYPVGRSLWHLRAIFFLWVLGLIAFGGLFYSQPRFEWVLWAFVCLTLAGVSALLAWKKLVPGILHWDGQCWHWSNSRDSGPCDVDLLIDLQNLLLIRVRHVRALPAWYWLDSQAAHLQWIALRRALVSGAKLRARDRSNQCKEAVPEA